MNHPASALRRLALVAALCLGLLGAAHATDYTVNDLTDTKPTLGGAGAGTTGDLRYCITQAGYGAAGSTHTISFAVTGTITLAAHELVINSNLTINGPGAANLTIDANHASRVVFIVSGHTVALAALTLTHGTGIGNDATGLDPGTSNYNERGGGLLNDRSALTLTDCTVSNNTNTSVAAAGIDNLALGADAVLTVNNCLFTGNIAKHDSGGGCLQNVATSGGTATLIVNGCTISGNTSDYRGGGIYNSASDSSNTAANVTVSHSTVSGNSAQYGGGIYSEGRLATVTITDTAITNNAASSSGGGILQRDDATMTLLDCAVTGNTSTLTGGGISNLGDFSGPTLTLSHCTVSGNTATTSGGGVYNFAQYGQASTTLAATTISGNSAQQRGGGIYNYADGGGLTSSTATLTASNCTIANNSSQQRGGGIDNYADGGTAAAVVANGTLGGNSALSGGAGIANDRQQSTSTAATLTLSNSILALHPTGANFATAYGTAVSNGFNLTDDATGTAFLTATGDLNNTPAGLQTDGTGAPLLQDNGGSIATIALLPGSPAIDGGKAANDPFTGGATSTDQRGLLRPFDLPDAANAPGGDASDIGAFESGSVAPPAPVITSATAATGQVAVAFVYQTTAVNGPTSYDATGLPGGLVFNPATGTISGTPTVSGQYTVVLTATNAGGTATSLLALNLQPAGPAPVVTSAASATGQAGVAFSYLITGTHTPTSFAATSLPTGLSVNTTTGLISGTPTQAGFFNVTLTAKNSSGTGSAALALTIQAASPSAPVITSANTATGQVGAVFVYQITASNGPTAFDATGLPAGLGVTPATGVISGTPTAAGTFTVTISATNASGTASIPLTLTVQPASTAPVITSSLTVSALVNKPFTYQITATNNPTSFGASGLPVGLTVNTATGVISGTPTVVGENFVTLTAANAGGTGSASLYLLITPTGSPVITSATSATGRVGAAFSFQITATNNPVSFNANPLPPGLSLATSGVLFGTPTAAGTYVLNVAATNTVGDGFGTLTLTILPPAMPPVVTSGLNATTQFGQPFGYQITATNGPTSFGAAGLPTGLSVNPATGLISGKPVQAGVFAVTLSASNADGTGTATLTLTVTVPVNATQPVIALVSPPNNISVVAGTAVPLAAFVTDPDSVLAQVQFLLNGQVVSTLIPPGPYTAATRLPAAGTFTLLAVATDALGRTSSSAVTINATAYNATKPPPTGSLLTPIANRLLTAGSRITLTAAAASLVPGDLSRVVMYVDGAPIATFDGTGNLLQSSNPGTGHPVRQDDAVPAKGLFSAPYQLPGIDKVLTLLVAATDNLGQTTLSDPVVFQSTVTSDHAPLVAFTNLVSPVKVPVGTVTEAKLAASDPDGAQKASDVSNPGMGRQDAASDGTLAGLEYFLNGKSVGQALVPPFGFSFTPKAAGKYVLHAVATDGSGLATVSEPVVVQADEEVKVSVFAGNNGLAVEGGAKGVVVVTRTGDTSAALTVAYKAKGAARAGVDYKKLSGTVTIPAGAVKAKIKIKAIAHRRVDGARVVKIKLANSADGSYTLGNPNVTKVKILDGE